MTRSSKPEKKPIEQYDHKGKERCNNPPVGLVTPDTDKEGGKKTYAYDPRTIIEAVRKRNGAQKQMSLFEYSGENPPLREAIEFYKHKHNWSNRMIAGDRVAESLIEKFHPEKIILFGSQARGTADIHSDIDLLIISSITENRRRCYNDAIGSGSLKISKD